MKKLILKSFIFLIILSGIIYNIDNYFAKDQGAFLKHHFFYQEENNSLDVLIFGDSHTYCGISSDIIKAKTGLNTYNYGLAGLNFTEVYYNLLEALEYQTPKLVIIECYPLIGLGQEKNYLDDEGIIKRNYTFSLEGKKIGLTKFKEAKLSIPNYNILKTFNIFKYHENWSDLEKVSKVLNRYTKNSTFPPFKDSAKDVVFMSDQIAENFSKKEFKDSIYVSEDHKMLVNKIINLSKEKKFKLLFVTVPFYEKYYSKTKKKFDAVQKELADVLKIDKSIKILDINSKIKLDNTNFMGGNINTYNYNNQHLNYKGNIKATSIIGNFINDNYNFNKSEISSIGLHDVFYNYEMNSNGFEGELIETKNSVKAKLKTSVFQGEFSEVMNDSLVNYNGIEFNSEFDNPIWLTKGLQVTTNIMTAPNGKLEAEKIIGTGNNDGYILQKLPNKEGTFKWSMWLKGIGNTRLRVQENGDDYTNYDTYNIQLTPNWKRYSLFVTKDIDENEIRVVLSGIQHSDIIYSWGAELNEVKEVTPAEKKINNILITVKDDKVTLNGWMYLKDAIIEDKFIVLKKNNTFNYISLKHEIKTIKKQKLKTHNKGSKHIYIFETPKDILEKGKYEIFQIARSDKNKFYIKKLQNKISIN